VSRAFGAGEGQALWNYMADIHPDRAIDGDDIFNVSRNFGKSGTYITELTGITITFNTGEERTPDSDGFVTTPQNARRFTVKRYGNPIGAMITFWQIGTPVAYSTTFEFTVPLYIGDDVDKTVHYYVLARVYVPSDLAGENFYFVATADASVQNVKMDNVARAGSGSSVNIDLETLSGGYHLLEFELVEVGGIGWVNFHVATASEEYAWLTRFRIYVPNFSDTEYRYTVKTTTWCPIYDDYFLIGYADDFIDDVHCNGLVWQDWEWNCSPYDTIYAWGDGFCYPLGRLPKEELYDISFTFGEINATGLLDFQYISWTNQQDKIGPPKFYASSKIMNLGSGITLNDGKIYGGSRWDEPDKPEISERTYEIRTTYDVSYKDLNHWFNACLEVGVGNWWLNGD